MKYSIVVPVYNVEQYVGACLQSIRDQSLDDYEIVIVNDGSEDMSGRICREFALANPKIPVRIIEQENKGLLLARRAGIRAAAGEYVIHLDSDDTLRWDAIELINQVVEDYRPDLILFRGSFSHKYERCQLGKLPWNASKGGFQDKAAVLGAFIDGYIPNLCFKVAKRSCIDIQRSYEEYAGLTIGEDQLQSLHLLISAQSIYYLDEPLYYYRQIPSSSTGSYRSGKQAQYGIVKEAVYRQALNWDEQYPGRGFADRALKTYLANAYYDIRKSAQRKTIHRELDELRGTSLFQPALAHLDELRIDQRLFCRCVEKKKDYLAYALCIILRRIESLGRMLLHVS